tara:strand:+ start:1353 stop:2324 length:972 start_codon:yes stop_codon:yes gene_type:complete
MLKTYENFFICITLLQLKIATKIIEKKRLNKENCLCFYYSNSNTASNRYYLGIIKKKCSKIIDLRNTNQFPKYFFLLRKKFNSIKVTNAYVSNIDGIYVQFVLSLVNPIKIFTFDDGAGNLYQNTNYNIGYDFGKIKSFIYKIFGNKFSVTKIISKRICHYSIFDKYKNFSSKKIIHINLFQNIKRIKKKKNKSCNVVLGTVIDEYFSHKKNKYSVKKNFSNFLSKFKDKTFYIKHPRAKLKDNFNNKKIINVISKKIAEDFIIENLITNYDQINLYCYPVSTVQINLEKFREINNILILTDDMPQRAFDGIKILKKYSKVYI